MTHETEQVEVLGPEEAALPVLRVTEPMEKIQAVFDLILESQKKNILWAEKTVIDSIQSRDEARDLRKALNDAKNKIDSRRQLLAKPINEFLKDVKAGADRTIAELAKAIADIDAKGVAFAEKQRQEEARLKAEAAAIEEAARKKAEAEAAERFAEEQRLRAEEDKRLADIEAKALADAQAAGHTETDALVAETTADAERQRIEQERAEREEQRKKADAAAAQTAQQAHSTFVGTMAKTTGKSRTKGVKDIWVIEIENEALIPPQFKTYDPTKARKFLEAGLATETDQLKIIPGLRCYKALKATGN